MDTAKPKLKPICVPNYPNDKDRFLREAEQLWKKRNKVVGKKRGPKDVAKKVFDACDKLALKLIKALVKEQKKFHITRCRNKPRIARLSWGECAQCRKQGLYKLIPQSDLVKAVVKKLSPFLIQCRKRNSENSDLARNVGRDVRAWVSLQQYPEWLDTGIPKKYQGKFKDYQIEAYDMKRAARPQFEKAEEDSLLFAATIQDHYKNNRLLPKRKPLSLRQAALLDSQINSLFGR